MMKKLIKHGNSSAIILDKTLLEAAGLSETALIQSVEDNKTELFQEKFEELNVKYKDLMQKLADL